MTRRVLGVVVIACAVALTVAVAYWLMISAGMPHGRMINGRREWLMMGSSVAVVGVLLCFGYHLWSSASKERDRGPTPSPRR